MVGWWKREKSDAQGFGAPRGGMRRKDGYNPYLHGVPPDDDEHVYETVYVRRKKTIVEKLQEQPTDEQALAIETVVRKLILAIDEARQTECLLEPFHVQFVGKPRQGKTQASLRLLSFFKKYGMITVARNSEDVYFDDLQKSLSRAIHERNEDGTGYLYHPDHIDKRMQELKVDVMLMDELYAKRKNSPDIPTILNGITPMPWKPLMADPKNKGYEHKPLLWLTTANHEVTDHDYNVLALLKRVHRRIVVEGGNFYIQRCFQFQEKVGTYKGGFKTCHGRFGVWKKKVETHSKSTTTGYNTRAIGSASASQTVSVVDQFYNDVYDTSDTSSFVCEHCIKVNLEELITLIAEETIEKIHAGMKMAA